MAASKRLLVFLLLSAYAAGYASAMEVPIKRGQWIVSARKALIAQGWEPTTTYLLFGEDFEHSWGDAGQMFKAGMVEVEICAGTGRNPCVFNYRHKSGKCLRVFTSGELVDGRYPSIEGWSFECPAKEALEKPLSTTTHEAP